MLYNKWWKNPGDTCTRTEKGKESKANALGVSNIGKCMQFFVLQFFHGTLFTYSVLQYNGGISIYVYSP